MNHSIAARRLRHQSINPARHKKPADLVAWMGAVQAQEYEPARWGLGLRMAGADAAVIERAFEEGLILRTHVMRPTWHFVTAVDIRWMLALTGPRIQQALATYDRQLELDAPLRRRGIAIIERAVRDRTWLTRVELAERLEAAGLGTMRGQRLAHLVMHAEQEAVVCSGPRRGKKFTYALVAERAPQARMLSRDEAIAELTVRFLRSHGPATIKDLVWWSGLPSGDAKRGIEMTRAKREEVEGLTYWTVGRTAGEVTVDQRAHLLPIYDEYVVAYRDRVAVPHGPGVVPTLRESVIFQHALVIGGQIAGTWRMTARAEGVSIAVTLTRPLKRGERTLIAEAAERYGAFTGATVVLSHQ